MLLPLLRRVSPVLCNRLWYCIRGFAVNSHFGKPVWKNLAPLRRGFFVPPSDTETDGSVRRFVSGLPPMLSPFPRCRSLRARR